MTGKEQMSKFNKLIIQCDIQEDNRLILSRFRTELKFTLVQTATDAYLLTPLDRKFIYKVGEHPNQQGKYNATRNTYTTK